jgi:hypothetical protein
VRPQVPAAARTCSIQDKHIDIEDLALLAEGRFSGPEAHVLRDHLAVCRRCYASYEEAVRRRSEWIRGQSRPEKVPAGTPARRAVRRRIGMTVALATALTVVVLGGVWLLDSGRDGVPREEVAPVRTLVAEASATGLLFPETEPAPPPGDDYRGPAQGAAAEIVDRALGRLMRRFEAGEGTADSAYWLAAGVLARGRLDDARVLLAETQARYPGDLRFEVLEAILAFRGNDLRRARLLLESVVERNPKDAVAWTDLGVVRAGLGLSDQAREAWERARAADPGSPAARRAEAYAASS